jgi:hypothetical protein
MLHKRDDLPPRPTCPYLWIYPRPSGIVGRVTDWLSPLSALLGAVVGAGSALLTQRAQWRQQMNQRDRDARRDLYGAYLTVLHETGENLWAISSGNSKPADDDFRRSAHDAFQSGALFSLRSQIMIVAPEPVVDATRTALVAMRHLRDCVAEGLLIGSEKHDAARRVVRDSNQKLRAAMRADLRQDT